MGRWLDRVLAERTHTPAARDAVDFMAEDLRSNEVRINSAAACLDCGGVLPAGHRYRCQACVVAAWWRVYGADPPTWDGATHAR